MNILLNKYLNFILSTAYSLISIIFFFILQFIACLMPIILYLLLLSILFKNMTLGLGRSTIDLLIFLPVGFIFAFGGSARILSYIITAINRAYTDLLSQYGIVEDSNIISLVNKVAYDIGIEPFEEIYFDLEPDFSTFYIKNKRYIILGLTALEYLTEEEFKSIIAHECAHYHNNSMCLSRTHYQTKIFFESYERTLRDIYSTYKNRPKHWFDKFIFENYGLWLFSFFTPLVKIYNFFFSLMGVLVRNPQYEYYCDSVAAKYAGGNILASSLQKLYDLQISHYEICHKDYIFEDARFNHVEALYIKYISKKLHEIQFKNPKIRIESSKFGTVTHPSLISRLERVSYINKMEDCSDFLLSKNVVKHWIKKLPLVFNDASQFNFLPPISKAINLCIFVLAAFSLQLGIIYLSGWNSKVKVEEIILDNLAFQQLHKYDFKSYRRIKEKLSEAIHNNKNKEEILRIFENDFNLILSKYLTIASDESLLTFTTYIYNNIFYDSEICYKYITQGTMSNINKTKGSNHLYKIDKILATIIITGSENPTHLNNIVHAKESLNKIYEDLAAFYGEDIQMLQFPRDKSTDKRKVCIMMQDLYRRMLQLPKKDSVSVLRYFYSNK